MGLKLAFRTNISALIAWMFLALLAPLFGVERANATIQAYPLKAAFWGIFAAFFVSMLWLYVQSWVMLARAWTRREGKENAKLFLILFFFNFAAAYYFYWKRDDIDSTID